MHENHVRGSLVSTLLVLGCCIIISSYRLQVSLDGDLHVAGGSGFDFTGKGTFNTDGAFTFNGDLSSNSPWQLPDKLKALDVKVQTPMMQHSLIQRRLT